MAQRVRVSERVAERVRQDFTDPEVAAAVIDLLEEWGNAWPEWEVDRVQAAIVLSAAGGVDQLLALVDLAYTDYRDVLGDAGFADEDWSERMEAAFRAQ